MNFQDAKVELLESESSTAYLYVLSCMFMRAYFVGNLSACFVCDLSAFFVFGGCHSRQPFEIFAEERGVGEVHLVRDLCYCLFRVFQFNLDA